jgi:hypothetical protein
MHAVSRLPRLAELDVSTVWGGRGGCIPLGLFANLSTLIFQIDENVPFFISEMSAVIANSPQLKILDISFMESDEITLGSLFAKIPTKNPPICLEHLSIRCMDATVDQVVLPHLRQLTSFEFTATELQFSRRTWTSFLDHNVKLLKVEITEIITEETMIYLSSFSGLVSLVMNGLSPSLDTIEEDVYLKDMLLTTVLPKHVNSLQTLVITQSNWVKLTFILSVLHTR